MKRRAQLKILFTLPLMVLCGITISAFLIAPVRTQSNIENLSIEKKGRLTIVNFNIKTASIATPIPVRAAVSRETKFRVSFGIAKDFPQINTVRLEVGKILWTQESEPAGKAHRPDSCAGVFLAVDGDLGYILSRLHSHRIYRKHLDQFEIDYVFSSDLIPRSELVKYVHSIDKEVVEALKNSGAFSK